MSEKNIISILITALGGEGGGTLMNWILDCARSSGLHVQGTSVPGVAQRTGSTSYYIEICDKNFERGKEPILSLYPKPGRVDVLIASELLEAARTIERGYVNPDRTTLITSSNRTYTNVEKIHTADGRFDLKKIMDTCSKMSKEFIYFDMNKIAIDNSTIVSATMFGALSGAGVFPWDKNICEKVFDDNTFGRNSLLGFNSAFELAKSKPKIFTSEKISVSNKNFLNTKGYLFKVIQEDLPKDLWKTISLGYSRCLEYQNKSYADLYLERIKSLISSFNLEKNKNVVLLENIIKRLALWMTYEDIPRVAELKISPDRFAKIKKEVKLQKDQLIIIHDIFKPGKTEIAAMLPNNFGKWLSKINKPYFIPFFGKGIKINSLSVSGFLILKFLSLFKYIRKISYRYQEEQKNIEEWLGQIRKSIKFSTDYTEGLADMPQILKGYGDTWERGKLKYGKINNALIKNKNIETVNDNDAKVLKKAVSISLNELDMKDLDSLLEKHLN